MFCATISYIPQGETKPLAKLAALNTLAALKTGCGGREVSVKTVLKVAAWAETRIVPALGPAVSTVDACPVLSVSALGGFTDPEPPVTTKFTRTALTPTP